MEYKKISSGFILKLIKGENIAEKITEFCEKEKVFFGLVKGIGALEKAEIAHFSLTEKKYINKVFEEDLEVLSFIGNIALKEEKPFMHVHITLGKNDFSVFGGHFVSGIVGATMEIFIQKFEEKTERKKDKETELFLLDLEK